MTTPRLTAFALTLALLSGSCDSATAPAAAHGLELHAHVGLPQAAFSPSFPIFTTELINVSAEEITVVFGTTCTVLGYIVDARGKRVYPPGGAWGCGDAITPVTLASGHGLTRSIELRTGATPELRNQTLTLPPGRYVAYAEMEGSIGDLGGQRVKLRGRGQSFILP
jgi:hypothetical protein